MDSDKKSSSEKVQEGLKLLAVGKRNLLCKEYDEAVCQLAQATQILTGECGEMGLEVGEAYLSYGSALLSLHQSQATVLGDAIQKENNEEEDDEDEEEDEKENGGEVTEENGIDGGGDESGDNNDNEKGDNNDDKNGVDEKGGGDEDKEETEDGKKSNEKTEKGDEGVEDDEEEEDVTNVQLAWEVLEMAKIVFNKDTNSALKLADTHFKLADVSLESEQFEAAVSDYEACLQIQLKHLKGDSRSLAETYYQLGLAHCLLNLHKPAIQHFLNSIQVLEERVIGLKKEMKEGEGETKQQSSEQQQKPVEQQQPSRVENASAEVLELKELIKEVYLKIEEVVEEEKQAAEVSQQLSIHLSPSKITQLLNKNLHANNDSSLTINNDNNLDSKLNNNSQSNNKLSNNNTSPTTEVSIICVKTENTQQSTEPPQQSTAKVNVITHLVRKKESNTWAFKGKYPYRIHSNVRAFKCKLPQYHLFNSKIE